MAFRKHSSQHLLDTSSWTGRSSWVLFSFPRFRHQGHMSYTLSRSFVFQTHTQWGGKKRAADSVSTRCRIFQVMCAGQETRSIIAIAFKQLLSTKKLTTGAINIDYVLPHRAAEAPFLCVYGGYDMASCGSCLIWNVFFFTFSLWWGLVMRDLGMILPA